MASKSSIVDWYKNKSIFITGPTGFMGKVLIEKLLYSCPGIKQIFILIRSKRDLTPAKRIEMMWQLPLFDRLRESQPNAIEKIRPVIGDLNFENLNLSIDQATQLFENVNVIFHLGATLKLEATLHDAIEQNTGGTRRLIDLARRMKQLEAFIHFSTAFCSADVDVFEECVYDCKEKPRDVIEVTRWMDVETLELAKPALIAPHPNTYTYSKRLAEKLVADEIDHMPVCIVRPSIVIPAVNEPLPGWVDSLNGPMGLLVGGGKGVIRSMYCKGENHAQMVPVDIAINASIVIAYKVATKTTNLQGVPVYNLTQGDELVITYQEILDVGRNIYYDYPFEMQIWYPDGDIRSSKFIHNLYCIFFHWLPAYLIDFLLFIFMQKRFMLRIQRKIHDGLDLLEFFAVREWRFTNKNFLDLFESLNDEEKKIFNMDFKLLAIEDYFRNSILGARQYLMKEPLSSLPACRRKQSILYVLHKTMIYTFYFFVFYWIFKLTPFYDFESKFQSK